MHSLSSRWLVVVAGVVVALILVSVVITLVNPRGDADILPEDTPEGVVQRFILAVQDREYSLAYGYLSDELKETCTIAQMEDRSSWFADSLEDNRVALLDSEKLSGGRTQVRVRVTRVSVSPPFGVDEYSHQERYILVQENGEWRFADPPWPLSRCRPPAAPTTIIAPIRLD